MSYSVGYAYGLGSATMLRAMLWHKQQRLKEARSQVLRAVEIFGKLGAVERSSNRFGGN